MSQSFLQKDEVKTELTFKQLFKKLWPFMRKHKGFLGVILLLVIAYASVGRAIPVLFGYAIDEGITKKNLDIIKTIAIFYLVAEILRSVLVFFQAYLSQKLGNRVLYEIRETLINHVQHLRVNYFDKNPVGRTVTRVTNDIASLGELFSQGFTTVFVNVFELISIVIAMFIVSPTLTLVTVLVGPLIFKVTAGISRRIRKKFRLAKGKIAQINAHTAESINGIKVLQLYNRAKHSRNVFKDLSKQYKDLQYGTVRLFAVLWPMFNLFNATTVATAILVGGIFMGPLGLQIGELSAFILLIQSFFKPMRNILERYNQFQNSLASADRIFALLDEDEESVGEDLFSDKPLDGRIEFKDLTFSYDEKAGPVLKNINFTIEPGESVALVGRTGSGKSTTISLMQKLYEVEQGDILIDNLSIKTMNPQSLRRRVGVVQQDNFVFRGTIASNISIDNPRIEEATVVNAAKRANCDQLIRRHGLNGKVEERGANLSVGEKQLLAFARVLAFDPDILILDEATANIDSQSENLIKKATDEITKGRTSLIIAHRLSTILNCDRIIVLDKGEIIEVGSHDELIQNKGHYWHLYQSQFVDTRKKPSETDSAETTCST